MKVNMEVNLDGLFDQATLGSAVTKAVSDLFKGREEHVAKAILAKGGWGDGSRSRMLSEFLNDVLKKAVREEVREIVITWMASKREELRTEVVSILDSQPLSERMRPVIERTIASFSEEVMREAVKAAIGSGKEKPSPSLDYYDE